MAGGALTDWIGVIIAVIGSSAALVQYSINSRRNKAIKAADEIDALLKDKRVKAVLRMIERSSGYVVLESEVAPTNAVFVGEQEFLLSLRHHGTRRNEIADYNEEVDKFFTESRQQGKSWEFIFSPDEQMVRDAFDDFLGRLERIESLMKNGVIAQADFSDHFSYWLKLMDENEPTKPSHFSIHKRTAFWRYIREYEFNGVIRLFARFGRVKS